MQDIFISSKSRHISRYEFNSVCNSLSAYIREKFPDDKYVIIYYSEPIDIIISFFSVIAAGKVAVPLSYKLPISSLYQSINYLNSYLVLSDIDIRDNDIINYNCRCLNYKEVDFKGNISDFDLFENINDKDEICSVILSSGSTGEPKYVAHSFNNHYYAAISSNERIPLEPGNKWLLSLPLNHIGGISILFRIYFSQWGSIVAYDKSKSLSDNINTYGITHCSIVPTQLKILSDEIAQDRNNYPKLLKYILVGGSSCPDIIKIQTEKLKLPVIYSYGSSEMTSQICTAELGENIYTCGKPLRYTEVKISEKNEICVKGRTLFKGYIKNDGSIELTLNDGYFNTNDLGKLDEYGNLIVLGRKDNLIICGGENIYPREIESELFKIPQINNAKVLAEQDDYYGNIPVAHVELRDNISEEKILEELAIKLPQYKLPKKIIFATDTHKLPDNKDLKIMRNLS